MNRDSWLSGGSSRQCYTRYSVGLILLNVGGLGLFTLLSNWWVSRAGGLPLFDSVAETPQNEFGLLLGTAPTLANGNPNRYFVFRMNAAAELFHAGKVKILILSGNRRGDGYDEPAAMREALAIRGVPENILVEDTGGVRTFDSVVRAKWIFGLNRLTVISQEFHNRRALFFCRHFQIDAIAINARPVVQRSGWRLVLREFLARAVAVLNVARSKSNPMGE
jgi:SanA protein